MTGIAGGARSVAVLLVAATALASPAAAQEPRASLPDLEDEVMCPVCGTTLELSGSPQAERQRALIRDLIDRGLSKDEIKGALVDEYGEEVLALPESEGFDLAAWLAPAFGFLAALGLIAGLMLRARARDAVEEDEARAIDPAEAAKLRDDMASYDG